MPHVEIPMLPQLLRQRATERPDGVIVESVDGDALTYGQLVDASARWAAVYASIGVAEGDRVVSIMSLGLDWFRHWGALMWLGAVDVPLNTDYRGSLLAHAVNTAAAATVVTTSEHLERLDAIADELREVRTIVLLDATGEPPTHDRWRVVAHPAQHGELAPVAPAQPQRWDIASVLFTSGTTGPSKGVLVPWAQLHATAVNSFPFGDLGPADTMYLPSVTYHLGPKYALYAMSLLDGRVVTRNRFSATAFWDDIERHDCTTTVLISSMVPLVTAAEPTSEDAATPLRNVLMAPPPPTVDAFKQRFGVRVSTCFNMTEISVPINTGWTVDDANHASCGRPRAGVDVRIVDEHDIEVEVGAVGELVVRADEPWTLNVGYLGQPEATARAWRNGWFHTGDGFRRDANGNHYFVDRIKDSIRRRGENISSFEVEGGVNQHRDVLESAAVAVPSPLGEDEVMVFVVPRPGSGLTPAALIEDLRDRLPRFMIPRYVELVDALPKTPTDRIQKARLRERGVGPATFDRTGASEP